MSSEYRVRTGMSPHLSLITHTHMMMGFWITEGTQWFLFTKTITIIWAYAIPVYMCVGGVHTVYATILWLYRAAVYGSILDHPSAHDDRVLDQGGQWFLFTQAINIIWTYGIPYDDVLWVWFPSYHPERQWCFVWQLQLRPLLQLPSQGKSDCGGYYKDWVDTEDKTDCSEIHDLYLEE